MRKIVATILTLCAIATAAAQPKLTVNIIVGGMKSSDLDR